MYFFIQKLIALVLCVIQGLGLVATNAQAQTGTSTGPTLTAMSNREQVQSVWSSPVRLADGRAANGPYAVSLDAVSLDTAYQTKVDTVTALVQDATQGTQTAQSAQEKQNTQNKQDTQTTQSTQDTQAEQATQSMGPADRLRSLISIPQIQPLSLDGTGQGDEEEGEYSTPVVLHTEPANFSCTVPASLPITLGSSGAVICATDTKIVNNSYGLVTVSSVAVTPANGWTLEDYTEDFGLIDMNSKVFAMNLQGEDVPTTGTCDASNFGTIAGNGSAVISYAAKIAAQNRSLEETIANVTFVVRWRAIYEVKYYNYDGSELLYTEYVVDGDDAANDEEPARASTAQYSYTFVGWNRSANASESQVNAQTDLTEDRTLYAAYTTSTNTYTVTWKDSDGTTLETDTDVPHGSTPSYDGATPSMQDTGFKEWSPAISTVTGNVTYTAVYYPATFTVSFYNGDTLLETKTVVRGGTATYTGTTPVPKAEDIEETITDSWEEIIAACNDGTYATKYSIGDTKRLDLGTEGVVAMQIAAFDADPLASGSGNSHITWISKQIIQTSHRMNPQNFDGVSGTVGTGNIGGWNESEMRSWLSSTILPKVPATVRNAILSVTKYSYTRYPTSNGTANNNVTTTDKLWIPSYYEMGWTGKETSGPVYSGLFTDNTSRVKGETSFAGWDMALTNVQKDMEVHAQFRASGVWWWLRSTYTNPTYFYVVSPDGSNDYNSAQGACAVALGFCT